MIKSNCLNNQLIRCSFNQLIHQRRSFNESMNYTQGQYSKENSKTREYFYHITEEGNVFI